MSTKQPVNIPIALSQARHQLDLWRSKQPSKRTRLPKEFWQQAVALAKEHAISVDIILISPFSAFGRVSGSKGAQGVRLWL
jgi:hypothetical protein